MCIINPQRIINSPPIRMSEDMLTITLWWYLEFVAFLFYIFQGFGTTPSPATPSHGYNAPYTPGTPMSGVFGGDSGYSPIHTPSPMHGNPLTPGAGLGPLSPAYTPQTPMGQYDDETVMSSFRVVWSCDIATKKNSFRPEMKTHVNGL